MEENKSKISNVEWALVIGALFMIDAIQIVLEWLVIGIFINWIIDIFVGMSFALYLQLRGQSIVNPKRLLGLVGTFVAEMIPVLDQLPLWGFDGIFNMVLSKSDKIMSNIPGGKVLDSVNFSGKDRGGSLAEKMNRSNEQIRNINNAIKNRERRNANNVSDEN